jgi:polyisoprenoid-binding protein YceI
MNRFETVPWLILALYASAAKAYHLDADHTYVSFDIDRAGISWISARFGEVAGEFVVDLAGADSHLDVTIQTDSIEGPDAALRARIRSREWLDTQRFPEMRYRSEHVAFEGDRRATVLGQLTLHGVTRPVALAVSRLDCLQQHTDPAPACDFVANAQIKRSEFGLPGGFWGFLVAGNTVEISIRGTGLQ